MGKNNKIDAYIAKSADFARPVLDHLRELVHKASPEIEEDLKWGMPYFSRHGIVCSMASFKEHCVFGFKNSSRMSDPAGILKKTEKDAMGQFGRIKSLSDLPSDQILLDYIREAVRINTEIKTGSRKAQPAAPKQLEIPEYFTAAIAKNKKAKETFDAFSYANKKEYVEWITGAKREETRDKRLETAIEWMAEGKVRNWKYIKK